MNAFPVASTGATVAVAFSGGRDSLALLHATCHAAKSLGLQVLALHVHHGLLAQADAWADSATRLCSRWRRRGLPVRLLCHRVAGRPAPGDSVEAWARRERFAALTVMAHEQGVGLVLLAQHRRDQAETVVLQALRGSGPRGMAAMPMQIKREGITWARPWLSQSRESIDAYVRRHRLRPIEDPSNLDPRWARNRLRAQVWPVLIGAFGDAETSLAIVARRAQESSAALAELAAMDLAVVADRRGLHVEAWQGLSAARRGNVLRAWLSALTCRGAPESLVERLQNELPGRYVGRWPLAANAELTLYRGYLTSTTRAPHVSGPVMSIDLSSPGRVDVPDWGGSFVVQPVDEQGVQPHRLTQLTLKPRTGAERFQLSPRSLPRALKKQYQANALGGSMRQGPLVWSRDELLYVPGLGIDARCQAGPGEPLLTIEWIARVVDPAAGR